MSKSGIKKQELLTYAFLAIITFCKGIDLTSDSIFYVLLFIIGTALVFFKILREKFKLSEILTIIMLLVACLAVLLINRNNTPLFLLISIISMKGVDTKRALTVVFFVHLFAFIMMIVLSSTGVIHSEIMYHVRESVGATIRHNFGYKHPNLVQMHVLALTILYFYVFNTRNVAMHLVWIILNVGFYVLTYSRTSFYIALAFLFYHCLLGASCKVKKIMAIAGKYSFVFLSIITVILYLNYDSSPLVKEADDFLTGRIYYMSYIYKNYSISLFGLNDFGEHVYIDNSYFGLLYKDGLVIFLIAFLLNCIVCKKWMAQKKYDELILVLFLNLLCFTENYYLLPVINFSTLLYADVLFSENKRKEIEA